MNNDEKSLWHGFLKKEFDFEGQRAIIVFPDDTTNCRHWALKTEYWDAFPETETELLKRGFHIAYLKNKSRFATKEDCAAKNRFVAYISDKYDLSPKCVLIGMSCGGAHAVNFAGYYPKNVACMFIDAPVLNFFDYPSKYEDIWENEFVKAYPGIKRADLFRLDEQPMNRIPSLLKNNIPILMVYGTEDTIVDYNMNGKILSEAYDKNAELLTVMPRNLQGHHPHGFLDKPEIIADWIMEHIHKK